MKYLSFVFTGLLIALGFGADVISVTTGTAGNAGALSAELVNFLSAQMLDVATYNTILDQFAQKVPLPPKSGVTIQFNRIEKLTVAAAPVALVEGIRPDAVGLQDNSFTATVVQYGNLVRISDLAELTAKHPIVQQAMDRLASWAAEAYDQLVYTVLDAASNTYRPNNRAGDTSTLSSDVPAYNDLVELMAILMAQGGKPFDGDGGYIFVTSPQPYASLLKDPDYKAANQLAGADKIFRGEVGMLGKVRVVVSNSPAFATTSQATTGFSNKLYSSFGLAKNAYQLTDLQSLELIITPPGGPGDELKQSYKLGCKFSQKSVITNQNWIRRVRTSGNDSTTN